MAATVTVTNNTILSTYNTQGEWKNDNAFAVIKTDGSVVAWGDDQAGGDTL